MLKGQCLCGAVQYQYHASLDQTILCFCSHCRLAQGGIMAWNCAIEAQHFELLCGQEALQSYAQKPVFIHSMDCAHAEL